MQYAPKRLISGPGAKNLYLLFYPWCQTNKEIPVFSQAQFALWQLYFN
jgi:hypothetical protein